MAPNHGTDGTIKNINAISQKEVDATTNTSSTLNLSPVDVDNESRMNPIQSNPLLTATQLSQSFFLWAWPLLQLGSQRSLHAADLYDLLPEEESETNRLHISDLLPTQELEEGPIINRPSFLFRSTCRDYVQSMWFPQVLLAVSMLARLIQALALRILLNELDTNRNIIPANMDGVDKSNHEQSTWKVYSSAFMIMFCGFVVFMTKQRQFFLTYRKGMQLRVGIVASIYHKIFRMSSTQTIQNTKTITAKGNNNNIDSVATQAMNLASNDVERFLMAGVTGIYIIWGPIEALLILGVGVFIMGSAFAAGFALFMIVLLPMQFSLGKKFAHMRQQVATDTDSRVNLVSQAINGSRVMKMNAWEPHFSQRIKECRSREVGKIVLSSRYKALNESLYFFSSLVVAVVIFSVHVLTGNTLAPGDVFSTLTLLNLLQYTMTKIFAMAVMSVSECYISSRRIETFLNLPEFQKSVEHPQHRHTSKADKGLLLEVNHATCYWTVSTKISKYGSDLALRDIDVELRSNSLYGVLGVVGSGKSALLQALVGELPASDGEILAYSDIAYAPQDPWIASGTVKENILMGRPMQEAWYTQVVESCALMEDIAAFPSGDNTLLGDKGVQCSGGQRARIGLARAVYRDAAILILDDPFSAVDAKVGRWIYKEVIKNLGLGRGKCVVLATHQVHFLEDSSECFLMHDGEIKAHGSYSACLEAADGDILNSRRGMNRDLVNKNTNDEDHDEIVKHAQESSGVNSRKRLLGKSSASGVIKEDRNTGKVELKTWLLYIHSMGGFRIATLILILFILAQGLSLVSQIMIGKWAEKPMDAQDAGSNFAVVIGLTLLTVVIAVKRALLSFFFFNRAARDLHDRMTKSVLFSNISFFDSNPAGRILNRFAADVGITDEQLPLTLYDCLVGLSMAFGSVIVAIVVLPLILIILPPVVWYFVSMRSVFVAATREVKRLEGLARSPIFEMIGEAVQGMATIRSNAAASHFKFKFQQMHDAHTRAVFAFIACSRWFAMRLEFVTFSLSAAASLTAALIYDQGWFDVDPAVLGLALSLLLQLAGTNFPWIVRQSAEVVNQMIAVERVAAYGDLPPEPPTECDGDSALPSWPSNAVIEFNSVKARYQPQLPLVLNGVTFTIEAGEKVGVVGRTGSGKSTLVQTLFRLLEVDEGIIRIDGVDIGKLGLHKLRRAMSVINQVPVLFQGISVRDNLDPFQEYTDDKIWDALKTVQMAKAIEDLGSDLKTIVSNGGSNFSVGQRQLLCLARAILKNSPILVLDEATANIDMSTERLLKSALDMKFSNSTVIAIAHRLETVTNYDRILVLGDGKVLEFGSPDALLAKKSGHFASFMASQKHN